MAVKKNTKVKQSALFGKNGNLLLEKILANKDSFLKGYQPEQSYLYNALKAIYHIDSVYKQSKLEKLYGKIFDAYEEQTFYNKDGGVSIDAKKGGVRKVTFIWLTLKSLELSISEYINSAGGFEAEQLAWFQLSQQNFHIGMLRGAEHIDDDLKNQLDKLEKFNKKPNTERDDYIRSIKKQYIGELTHEAIYKKADKNIIGNLKLVRFSNIK